MIGDNAIHHLLCIYTNIFNTIFGYMFEWCSLQRVVRMGTSIDGRKPFWPPACVFSVNKLLLLVLAVAELD